MTNTRRFLPVLLLLFIGSGCAALVYEIVWFQLLQLVIGSSAISLGFLLGTFMGGMCLGSLLLPRVVSARHHPLRVYGLLELGIGIIGTAVLFAMPLVGGVYTTWAGPGIAGLLWRGLAVGVCLLPPTILMGATLPAVARSVETDARGIAWLGLFYGGNIGGAVLGTLLAGFYLLRVYDTAVATATAAAINVAVALLALAIATALPYDTSASYPGRLRLAPGAWTVYLAIGLSGMTALASEVIWTRLLSLLFGATVYTFSLIMSAFLVGLGMGSGLGSALGRRLSEPRVALAVGQMLLSGAMAWTAYMLTYVLPYWPIDPAILADPWLKLRLDLARCLSVVLPAAILWGASFPMALASIASRDQDPARLVAGVYAANTVGAIVGALGINLVVVWFGSRHAQQVLIFVAAGSAVLALRPRWASLGALALTAASVGGAVLLARSVPEVSGLLIGYGRYAARWVGEGDFIYVGEGLNSSVAVSRLSNGVLNYHNAGKIQASSEPQDMRLQRMLGHLTTLVPNEPRSVLVIGCGAGVTAGAVSIDPRVEHVTIAEIESLVPRVVSTYFSEQNFDVVHNAKVRIRIGDARHYLLTTNERFDAVTSDPLDPWVKGAATLYTREFFEIVKRHLNPGGAVTLFVQLYESNTETVKSEIATFFEAFPQGVVWGNTHGGEGYDLVLLGQVEPARIDLGEMEQRLRRPDYAAVARSLREIGFYSAVDLFSTYAGRASDLTGWLADAAINRDRNLRLQYLAGLGLNLYRGGPIYAELLSHRGVPDSLFLGPAALKQSLWEAIERGPDR